MRVGALAVAVWAAAVGMWFVGSGHPIAAGCSFVASAVAAVVAVAGRTPGDGAGSDSPSRSQ